MQIHHSQPGTRPSTVCLDQDYLRNVVARLSFPRVFGTPANARAEGIVAEELRRVLGSSSVVGKTRNVCWKDQEARAFVSFWSTLQVRPNGRGSRTECRSSILDCLRHLSLSGSLAASNSTSPMVWTGNSL